MVGWDNFESLGKNRNVREKIRLGMSGKSIRRIKIASPPIPRPGAANEDELRKNIGFSFMLRSRNQTTNQIPSSYKNDGFDWPFDLVIVT